MYYARGINLYDRALVFNISDDGVIFIRQSVRMWDILDFYPEQTSKKEFFNMLIRWSIKLEFPVK